MNKGLIIGIICLAIVIIVVVVVILMIKKTSPTTTSAGGPSSGPSSGPSGRPSSKTFIVGAKYLIQFVDSGAYISLQNNVKGQVAVTVPDVNSATAFTYQAENSFTPPFITHDHMTTPANNAVPFTTSLDNNLIYFATLDPTTKMTFANALQINNFYKQVNYGSRTDAANRDLTFRNLLKFASKDYEVRFIKV